MFLDGSRRRLLAYSDFIAILCGGFYRNRKRTRELACCQARDFHRIKNSALEWRVHLLGHLLIGLCCKRVESLGNSHIAIYRGAQRALQPLKALFDIANVEWLWKEA